MLLKYRKMVFLLVVSLIIAMVPCAVSAEDEALTEVISSAEEAVETILPTSITGGAVGMTVDAKSAVLIDAASGTVLFEQNSHDRLPPASVTKVMTMLLIMEAIDRGQMTLEDKVTISEKAASMGGSQMYMEPGEQQKLETLMLGIAVASANDACVAAAEYHSGTADIFVENMNKRAAELGMVDTNFVNTNGLPVANHYTSAYDIALMSKELLKHDKIQDWFSIWMTNITVGLPGKKQTELGLTNTNRMIKNYPGANGIKTGFTQDAGYCLSASAKKGDLDLISVIMGSSTSKIRFAEASKLLDYGFANYDSVKLAEKGEPMGMVVIEKGSPNLVNAVAPENISVLVKKGEKETIKGELVFKDTISAPIKKGDQLGELVIYKKDNEIARYPIVAEENVKKAGLMQIYMRIIKTLA
ncbi:MAG TPA: D-alanyl-D-alanine carboxypeptidase family protein [Anaerovoracaceae bacterium]|nr:D-alanyl-D-alanine carboxypeptidase family protein [Anaerovoracaceae bacterium]